MVLAGMSPIQSFILPAVLPYSILDEGANGDRILLRKSKGAISRTSSRQVGPRLPGVPFVLEGEPRRPPFFSSVVRTSELTR